MTCVSETSRAGLQTDISRLLAAQPRERGCLRNWSILAAMLVYGGKTFHKIFYASDRPCPREQSGRYQTKAMLAAATSGRAMATGIHGLFPTSRWHFEDSLYVTAVHCGAVAGSDGPVVQSWWREGGSLQQVPAGG